MHQVITNWFWMQDRPLWQMFFFFNYWTHVIVPDCSCFCLTFFCFNFFFAHKHVLQWITMKRYSQLSPSCILPWMHNFGVRVNPKWNSMNIKWARMALYETWARCGWQRPLHNQSSHKTSVSLKQKGVCGLNTDSALLTNDRQDKHELLNKMTE